MITEEVAKNIYRIPVFLPDSPLKELNSYLIKDPERSLLIDTGFRLDACLEALIRGLDELGEDPADVDILLTHMHSDHAGLAADIVGEERHIFISETDYKLLATNDAEEKLVVVTLAERFRTAGMPTFIIDSMTEINPAIAYSPKTGATQYTVINDGDLIHAGGYEFRCILTPGHTPGHICLWYEADGIMFTGDHVLFNITPNITAWTFVEDSLADYLNSLRAISVYPVKTSLPGHRKPGDFHVRIEELLRHHDIRLAEIERLISETPGSTAYDISGKMRWKIRATNWEEFPPTQKIFAVGECMAHLDYLMKRHRIYSQFDGKLVRFFSGNAAAH